MLSCNDYDMTTDIAQPTRQALAAQNRSLPNRVTGKLRRAITEMVWSGARRADAAEAAGMTDHFLRAALKKPHVIAFYRQELGVLRESGRAKTFHRLEALRDQDDNKAAAVKACQVLEQIADDPVKASISRSIAPGFVIQIVNAPSGPREQATTINVAPAPAAAEDELSITDDDPLCPIFRSPWDHGT
jgi:hypothetical protein